MPARYPRKKQDYQRNPLDLKDINIPLEIEHSPLDTWQQEIIDYWGDMAICSGRQVGKSAVMALKVSIAVLKYPGIRILVSSGSERQAAYLYEKIKLCLKQVKEEVIAGTPTMRLTRLKNGSEIYCLPTGQTGDLIRGLTLDVWVPDEAAYINDAIWATVSPMLWVAKNNNRGWIWALSTPAGKRGKFFECFSDKRFKIWRVSATDCKRIPAYELESWKKSYSKVQYAQEVLGEFVDNVSKFFSEELLQKCFKKDLFYFANGSKYLGVDVARYGGDENAFVDAQEFNEKYRVIYSETTERKGITDSFRKIIELNQIYNYRKIGIDDGGIGGGLVDFLLEQLHNKIVGLNNASRVFSDDRKKRKRLLKEDMYSNALILMEQGIVDIRYNEDLYNSLNQILFEYNDEETGAGKVRIYGRDSHLAEAFVRALWLAKKKSLNLWVASKSYGNINTH